AWRPEDGPGAPSSASTHRPESSANAGRPVTRAALRAFNRAFSTKLSPVSGMSSTPRLPCATNSNPASPSSRLNSASFPGLPLATTMRFMGLAGECLALDLDQAGDALFGQGGHGIQLAAAERVALGGALQLDEAAAVVHHHVHVGVAVAVLGVIQVQDRHATVGADRHRDHGADHGRAPAALLDLAAAYQQFDRVHQRHVGAGDGGGAGTAIGLDQVAIQGDGAFAQRLAVDARAQAAADQALDIEGAATRLATGRLAVAAGVRGARQHAVLGGYPALALATQPRPDAVLDAGGAQHPGVAEADQHGPLG